MKWMIPVAVALGGFAAAFGGVLLAGGFDSRAKCEDPAAVETLKSLATDRLRSSAEYLLKSGNPAAREAALKSLRDYRKPELTVSAIRDREPIGKNGTTCAATVTVLIAGYVADILTTYSVEPTSDGKTMVTARFQPNS
jgi:hypothetical protein